MSKLGKLRKNATNFAIKNYYDNMTPEMYQQGVREAIRITEDRLAKKYNAELEHMQKQFNNSIIDGTLTAMNTFAIEILYKLGEELECYVKEPEYLERKIEVVQDLYEATMNSIKDYAGDKYKNNNQAKRVFEKKKKVVKNLFRNIYNGG